MSALTMEEYRYDNLPVARKAEPYMHFQDAPKYKQGSRSKHIIASCVHHESRNS